jgi:hypothetical protein
MFYGADLASRTGQRRNLLLTWIRLIFTVLASIGGAVTLGKGGQWGGALAATSFGGALITELVILQTRPGRSWYEGRAIAESAKTLAWKYAVAAKPFDYHLAPAKCEDLLLQRLNELMKEISGDTDSIAAATGPQVTTEMNDMRRRPLNDRKSAYIYQRLQSQQLWYTRKAHLNRRRRMQWYYLLLAIEVTGIFLGLFLTMGKLEFDGLGVAATLAAAIGTWAQIKQYETLASAYSIAAHELGIITVRARREMNEEQWSGFVHAAEEAVSREHKLWASRRSILSEP